MFCSQEPIFAILNNKSLLDPTHLFGLQLIANDRSWQSKFILARCANSLGFTSWCVYNTRTFVITSNERQMFGVWDSLFNEISKGTLQKCKIPQFWLVNLADRTISVRGKNIRAHQPGDWILVKTGLGANTSPRSYEFSPHRSRRTRAQTLLPPPCSVELLSVLTGSVLVVCKLKTIDLSTGLHISHGLYSFKDIC